MYFRLYAIVFCFIVRLGVVIGSESLHHFVLPSLLSVFGSLLDGLAGVVAGIVVYVGVALIAKALEAGKSAINSKAFHVGQRVSRLDWDDVMNDMCAHISSLTETSLAERLASELGNAQLFPLAAVVYLGLVLLLFFVGTSPGESLHLAHDSSGCIL